MPEPMQPNPEIDRLMERLERADRDGGWPPRWGAPPLDPDTVEFIARLNETERRNLIFVGNLSDDDRARIKGLLALDKETWEADIRLATRSASWVRVTKRFPTLVLTLAGFIVASKTIWDFVVPLLRTISQGGKP